MKHEPDPWWFWLVLTAPLWMLGATVASVLAAESCAAAEPRIDAPSPAYTAPEPDAAPFRKVPKRQTMEGLE